MSRIGFIGLGVMGRPMAENLLADGHELVVSSRSPEPVAALEAAGATAAATPAEAVRGADVAITMLPDGAAVAAVTEGEDGILAAAVPGTLLIEMSTIAPAQARELAARGAERGLAVLDAPVSGGDVGARSASLSIMVGGAAADFERALPLLAAMGSTVTRVGEAGAGQVVKAANQVLVALTIEGVAEALTLAESAGIASATVLDVLGSGLAANRVMEVRRQHFVDHAFAPGFRVDLHRKDLGIALDAAAEAGVTLPATPVVAGLLDRLREEGRGGEDHTALLAAVEALATECG
ncbi:MAG TPA: NAD(P)-dependent oxidoreductase [Solirubrobacterales bacterium]|nr:NAD(P)-dependent oxidoreductase [Solirubrobacterales bacterium]